MHVLLALAFLYLILDFSITNGFKEFQTNFKLRELCGNLFIYSINLSNG